MKSPTLNQISQIVKKEWPLILIGSLLVILFSIAIYSSLFRGKITQQTPPGTAWLSNIYAGTTTKGQLESQLGQPTAITQQGNNIIYTYPSNNQFRPQEVDLLNNTVSLIKEQIIGNEKGKLVDYTQKYGSPEAILLGKHGFAAPGHFWGKNGLLIFANDFDGTIVEIWYFEPSPLITFLAKHPELSTEPPKLF